jgi:hypothetical protein
VDVIENVGRAKDPEKAKDEQARHREQETARQEHETGTTASSRRRATTVSEAKDDWNQGQDHVVPGEELRP